MEISSAIEPVAAPDQPKAAAAKGGRKEKTEKSPNPPTEVRSAPPPWAPPIDPALAHMVHQVRTEIHSIEHLEARVARLAMFVSEKYAACRAAMLTRRMGGAVELRSVSDYDLDMANLKKGQASNVIPIGLVSSFP